MKCPKCGNDKTVLKPGWFIRRCRVCGLEFVDPVRRLLIGQIVFWVGTFFMGIIVLAELLQKMPPSAQQYGMLAYLIIFPIIAAIFLGRIVLAGKRSSGRSASNDRDYLKDADRPEDK